MTRSLTPSYQTPSALVSTSVNLYVGRDSRRGGLWDDDAIGTLGAGSRSIGMQITNSDGIVLGVDTGYAEETFVSLPLYDEAKGMIICVYDATGDLGGISGGLTVTDADNDIFQIIMTTAYESAVMLAFDGQWIRMN